MAGVPGTAQLNTDSLTIDLDINQSVRSYVLLGLLWAVAFSPCFLLHFSQLASTDHLSHFPLTILLACFLFYESRALLPTVSLRWTVYGMALAAVSLVILAGACYLKSGWLGTLSAIVCLWALFELAGGIKARRAMRRGWIMLFALLQPPFGLDLSLIIGLQKVASRVAGTWLDWQGIANLVSGVVIRTPQSDYLIDEACSGVNSLFAAFAVALFWLLYSRHGMIRSAIFLAAVVFWVLLLNAIRVWAIVYAGVRYQADLTAEPNHTLLGIATFGGAMLLSASTEYLMCFIWPPPYAVEDDPDSDPNVRSKPDETYRTLDVKRIARIAVPICLAVFAITAASYYRPASETVARGNLTNTSLVPVLGKSSMPASLGSWELKDAKRIERNSSDAFGMVSETWTYHNGNSPLLVSLDGPYDGWHDLGYCYGATGWQLRDAQNIQLATTAGQTPMTCVELNLYRGDGNSSLVLFTCFDSTGAVVEPPASHGSVWRNITNRLGMSDASKTSNGKAVVPPVFQVQMILEGTNELSPEERASIDQIYDAVRRMIAERLNDRESA